MSDSVQQKLLDSEESYLNTTFWDVHPLFLLVQNGETSQLKDRLNLQLESFPAGRITRDARKQLEYLTVSLVNTFMIAAIQGGVYPPEANAIADHALRRLSQIRSVAEIPSLVNEAARQLLAASDRTLPQIASLLRFCDQSYFTMAFRRQTGQTPGEYRKVNRR